MKAVPAAPAATPSHSAAANDDRIARKIAQNLCMLHQEEQVFSAECRMIFCSLAQRWTAKADPPAHQDGHPRDGVALRQPGRLKTG